MKASQVARTVPNTTRRSVDKISVNKTSEAAAVQYVLVHHDSQKHSNHRRGQHEFPRILGHRLAEDFIHFGCFALISLQLHTASFTASWRHCGPAMDFWLLWTFGHCMWQLAIGGPSCKRYEIQGTMRRFTRALSQTPEALCWSFDLSMPLRSQISKIESPHI